MTPRERQVFQLVAQGRLNKQIAHELGTSDRTIKAHRHAIMQKLRVQSVAEAVSIAERLGLPHPISGETAALAVSKLRQRACFADAEVLQPRFELASSPEEARVAAERLGYPCVVKAPDRQGQRHARRSSHVRT